MAKVVSKIQWVGDGYDLHLLPDMKITPSILQIVMNTDPPSLKWASETIENVNVDFKLNINGSEIDNPVHKFGIKFDRITGELNTDKTLPLPGPTGIRLLNFIIEATVTDKNTIPPSIFSSAVRIHVHDRLVEAWLTPSKLSIRHGSDGFRFSVLAKFEDFIDGSNNLSIGDITRQGLLKWESSDPSVKIDENGRLSSVISHASDIKILATFPLHNPFPPTPLSAKVDVMPSWSSSQAIAKLVDRREISKEEIENYPNILFIPEGYSNEKSFVNDIEGLVEEIKNSSSLSPFNLLSKRNRLNYWVVFIESPEPFDQISAPLHPIGQDSTKYADYGTFIESFYAVKPDSNNPSSWTLEELIYRGGMPTLADYLVPDDDEVGYNKKIEEWNTLFGGTNLNFDNVPKALWNKWRYSGGYTLANETNSTLGIVNGTRPNVDREKLFIPAAISWNPLRTSRKQLNEFLEKIKIKMPDGTEIDTHWASGKDKEYVVVVCRRSNVEGTETPDKDNHLIAMSLIRSNHTLENIVGVPGISPVFPQGVEMIMQSPRSGVFCHELSHALGLGDEYGGSVSLPKEYEVFLKLYSNLQSHTDLKNSPPETGINGKNIKWNWPRITKAGIVKEFLTPPSQATIKIRLDKDYKPIYNKNYFKDRENFFNNGNLVRLRQRPLPSVKTSKEFKIISITHDPEGEVIEIMPTNSAEPFNPPDFPEGSLLIATRPVLPEFPDDPPYREIVHKAVRNHINVSKGPLNAEPSLPTRDCASSIRTSLSSNLGLNQLPTNIPVLRHPRHRNLETIIGIYENGMGYYCNVYHPSGNCIMRGLSIFTIEFAVERFCHVCRYFLVDKLDPSLHAEIDREYERDYPFR